MSWLRTDSSRRLRVPPANGTSSAERLASWPAPPLAGDVQPASPPWTPAVWVSASRVLQRVFGAPGLLAAVTCALMTTLVFWHDLVNGTVYWGGDTASFYYPLTTWWAEQLRSGRFPLWVPYIYGGYPLFADGEIGMLYPLQLLAFSLLPGDEAFVWLRPLHFWLASVFTYWFGRQLGLRPFGALLAGLAFGFGSFMVGHLQHENIIRSSIWLPLALGAVERAYRARGARRLLWLLGVGIVVGIQMLGVHVQPVLLSLLAIGGYILVAPLSTSGTFDVAPQVRDANRRVLPGGSFAGRLLSHVAARVAAAALVTTVALGLAAVQLVPLYQLGERSLRAGGVSYEFSSSYSVPPTQLVQLLLPYIFRPDSVSYWGLWSAAETTVYLGIAPLLLALVAVAYLHRRVVLLLSLAAGLSLLLALGDYLPVKLYSLVWSLPGFSFLRVPARFSLLTVLAGALLAGFGADWLSSRLFDRRGGPRLRLRRLLTLVAGFSLGALLLAGLFLAARAWLGQDPGGTRQAIETYYLSLRRGELGLTAWSVYQGLMRSLDPANPRTLGALSLMVAVSVLLVLRGMHRCPRRAWQAGLLLLVFADLAIFAQGFYPQKPVGQLRLTLPSVQYLKEHNGLHRVFVEPALYGTLGPNQLVSDAIDLAGGYSSLEPRRAMEYWWGIVRQDTELLDLFNVRYVVAPRSQGGLPAYQGVLYHPSDRLMRGSADNPAGTETFAVGTWWTTAITVIASIDSLGDVEFGEPVAQITLRGPDGEQQLWLRAGQEVQDIAPLFGPWPDGTRPGPRMLSIAPSPQSPGRVAALYGSTLPLETPRLVTDVTVQHLGRPGALNLHGVGLHDRPGLPIRSLAPTDRAKYALVYQDQDVTILENTAALPRAQLVPSARLAERGSRTVVDQLLLGPFDPRQTVLLEAEAAVPELLDAGVPASGSAQIVEYGSDRVRITTSAPHAGYLILADRYDEGWRATVDGAPAEVFRANALFRAVQVPAGDHVVVFSYEPPALRIGAAISLLTVILVLAALSWCWRRARRSAEPAPG